MQHFSSERWDKSYLYFSKIETLVSLDMIVLNELEENTQGLCAGFEKNRGVLANVEERKL